MSSKELLNEYKLAMNEVQLIVNNMAEPMKMAKYKPTKCTGMLKVCISLIPGPSHPLVMQFKKTLSFRI